MFGEPEADLLSSNRSLKDQEMLVIRIVQTKERNQLLLVTVAVDANEQA